jgi:L-lactate dehydrogenase
VIVLTAGPRLRGDETRAQKAVQTARLLTDGDQNSIVSALANHRQAAGDACPVLLVVTNPVEATVTWLAEQTGWPPSRILGLGTTVETARFSRLLADKLNVDAASVWTEIIGEHGPDIDVRDRSALETRISEIGTAHVDIDDMLRQIRMAASQIRLLSESEGQARTGRVIAQLRMGMAPAQLPEPVRSALLDTLPAHLCPPATRFAIAAAVSAVIEAVASDGGRMLTVSGLLGAPLPGLPQVALALPFVLGRSGLLACAPPRAPSQVLQNAAASVSDQVVAMRAIRQA